MIFRKLVYTKLCPITRQEDDEMARIIEYKRKNIIGKNLKKARIAAQLSQKELAVKLETVAVYVCRGSISRIESGERTVTDIEVWGFSKVLNVHIADLFMPDLPD